MRLRRFSAGALLMVIYGFLEYRGVFQSKLDTIKVLKIGGSWLSLYHLPFLLSFFLLIAFLTRPVRLKNAVLDFIFALGYAWCLAAVEDASWFIARMLDGGSWISPNEWTCNFFGCITRPIVIPNWYFMALALTSTSLVLNAVVKRFSNGSLL